MPDLFPIRALIFDFDGLIVDTESTGYQTWRALFAEQGEDLSIETYAAVIGTAFGVAGYDPRRDLEQRTGRRFDWQVIEPQRLAHERRINDGLTLLRGVKTWLEDAEALGLPCAIASSSPRSWVAGWVERLGIASAFQNLTTVDDTGRVKPDPSLFLLAAERLKQPAENILILEDSLNGLRAAQAAGIRCLAVPGPMTRHLDFSAAWHRTASLAEVRLASLLPSPTP